MRRREPLLGVGLGVHSMLRIGGWMLDVGSSRSVMGFLGYDRKGGGR